MAQIAWPKKPFYIISVIGNKLHALTANETDESASFQQLVPKATQLWVALEIPLGINGKFAAVLANTATSKKLTYPFDKTVKEEKVTLSHYTIDSNLSAWRLEEKSDGSEERLISTLSHHELKLNVKGGDLSRAVVVFPKDNTPSEVFYIVEELGTLKLTYPDTQTKASFPSDTYRILGNVNGLSHSILIDNVAGGVPYSGMIDLSYTQEHSSTFTDSYINTVTKRLTTSLEIGGTIAKVLSLNAKAEFSTEMTSTVSSIFEESTKETTSYTVSVRTDVPAGAKYQYYIETGAKSYSSDYYIHAEMHSCIPGANPFSLELTGTYLGSNTVVSQIVVKDVTSSKVEEHFDVSRTPIVLR